MDNLANSNAIENSRINSKTLSDWCQFWFDLRLYLHPSWLKETQLESMLIIDNTKASPLLWAQLYKQICKELNIQQRLQKNILDELDFWVNFLPSLSKNPFLPIELSGSSLHIDNSLSINLDRLNIKEEQTVGDGIDNEKKSTLTKSIREYITKTKVDLSLPQKRSALHAKQCFSLDRRFKSLIYQDNLIVGLWFLYKSLSNKNKELWNRIRLAYHREIIEYVETYEKITEISDASYRSLKRLFRYVDNIVFPDNKQHLDTVESSNTESK